MEIQFKSPKLEKEWIELQEKKRQLQEKKQTKANLEKTDVFISLMTSCKKGFNLGDGKIKKTISFLREHTKKDRVRYGTLPGNIKPETILFKEITILYAEKDNIVIFREYDPGQISILPGKEEKKIQLTNTEELI